MAANRVSRMSYFASLFEPLMESFGCVSFAPSSLGGLKCLFVTMAEWHVFKGFVHVLEDLALEF